MTITQKSPFTGKEHSMEIAITPEQLADWQKGNRSAQECFPHLTPNEREFILTGITAEEWAETFGKEEDDDKNDEPFADESNW